MSNESLIFGVVVPHSTGGVEPRSPANLFLRRLVEELAESKVRFTLIALTKASFNACRAQYEDADIVDLSSTCPEQDFANGIWGIGKHSYILLQHLKANHYDSLFSFDCGAATFYASLAKLQGLALSSTTLITLAVDPTALRALNGESGRVSPAILALTHMERRVIELSDAVIGCESLISWYSSEMDLSQMSIKRWVGLRLNSDSELQANSKPKKHSTISILIENSRVYQTRGFIRRYLRDWRKAGFSGSVEFIHSGKVSERMRNTINTEMENLDIGWQIRMIDGLSKPTNEFGCDGALLCLDPCNPSHAAISVLLSNSFQRWFSFSRLNGSQWPVLSIEAMTNVSLKTCSSMGEALDTLRLWTSKAVQNSRTKARTPKVTVCVVHHERPRHLKRVLASLERQDYSNFNVIVVDDGSVDEETRDSFSKLSEHYIGFEWQFYSSSNSWLGAARNLAASYADGEYLIFMDDDNIASTKFVSTYVTGIINADTDALTCFAGVFDEDEFKSYADNSPPVVRDFLALGGALAAGCSNNIIGDASCIVKRSVFEQLGGFWECYGLPKEDHEFYMRLLASGFRLDVLPERLFFYRRASNSMMASNRDNANFDHSKRLVTAALANSVDGAVTNTDIALLASMATETRRSPPLGFITDKGDSNPSNKSRLSMSFNRLERFASRLLK